MKSFKILSVVTLLIGVSTASFAASVSTNASAGIGPLVAGRVKINDVTVINNTTNIALVHLFDSPGTVTNLTYTVNSYTVASVIGPTNQVTTYTNIFGTIENWTNSTVVNATTTVAANTNSYPKIVTFYVAASGTATWTPSGPTYTALGVVSSNSQAVTINLNYNR